MAGGCQAAPGTETGRHARRAAADFETRASASAYSVAASAREPGSIGLEAGLVQARYRLAGFRACGLRAGGAAITRGTCCHAGATRRRCRRATIGCGGPLTSPDPLSATGSFGGPCRASAYGPIGGPTWGPARPGTKSSGYRNAPTGVARGRGVRGLSSELATERFDQRQPA